jgi:hypothetical protein
VGDDQLVLERDGRERPACSSCVGALVLRGERLAPPQQRVASEGDEDAHGQLPRVAARTALLMRISYSSSAR